MKNKFSIAMSLAVVLAMLITSLALADNLKDDANSAGNNTITAGGSTTIKYWIQPIGGCDAADGSSATVTINIPAGVTASPSSLTFTACNTGSEGSPNNTKNVVFSSSTPGDYNITASVSDLSGSYNESPANFTLHVTGSADTTAPVISYVLTPSAPDGTNGWYKSNVTLTWTVTENESLASLVKTGCVDQSITADQVATTYSCSATSDGGSAAPVTVTIKRDATPPTISGAPTTSPNSNGWYNSDVTVHFACADATSGIVSCTSDQMLSGDGSNQSVSGTAVDNAGNSASTIVSGISIDKTGPTISATANPPVNANGWNNTDVTVSYTCTDGGSGVDAAAGDLGDDLLAASGTATGTCVDKAGNSATASYTAQIDKVKPVITGSRLPVANAHGWNNTDIVVSFSCTDSGGSGVDVDTVAGATVSTEGAGQSVVNSGSCTDKAGNVADAATVSGISIDKTAPTASASAVPAANSNGWNNTDVTVSFSGTDGLSGIDTCSAPVVLSSEGTGQSATGNCMDNAGNSASATASGINIDETAPTLSPSVSPNPVVLGGSATASPNATDSLSDIASSSCDPVDTSTIGSHSVTCYATDKAGNSNSATASYGVIYNWSGFFQPVDKLPALNRVKAGSAIPVKFSLGGNQGLNIFAAGYPASGITACGTTAPVDDVETTVTAGGSSLTYDAVANQYIYVWKTDKAWAGTCRTLTVKLIDGTTHQANFQLTK